MYSHKGNSVLNDNFGYNSDFLSKTNYNITPQCLYNMVCYNMVLDRTWVIAGPQVIIKI